MVSMTQIMLFLSLFPALMLMVFVYRSDYVKKESWGILVKMFLLGCLSTLPAMLFEMAGSFMLSLEFPPNSFASVLIDCFLIVAVGEEGSKYIMLRTARNNPKFDYTFDGIMYAVMVGLGFAALENVMYVFMYAGSGGLETAIVRAVTAVPMHCSFAVFMGAFFGMAKRHRVRGNAGKAVGCEWLAFVVPVLIHGFYDAALMSGDVVLGLLVWVFTGTVFACAGIQVKKSAFADAPLFPVS